MKKTIFFFVFSFFVSMVYAQNRYGHVWLRQNEAPIKIEWKSDTPTMTLLPYKHNAFVTDQCAVVSNSSGDLKFFANGCVIMDKEGDFLPNGKDINSGEVYDSYCWLYYPASDNIILLPKPDDSTRYVALHTLREKEVIFANDSLTLTYPTRQFSYSEIDATLNNGKGDVIVKNQLVFRDTLMALGIHACRHANGKDWWIIAPELLTFGFQRVLLTAQGVQYVGEQRIKSNLHYRDNTIGQISFSNDGTKYAIGSPDNGILLFDFDRCTGLFSNYRQIPPTIPRPICTGVAFSLNSQFLYVTERNRILQYDLTANNIAQTQIVIDTYDAQTDADFYLCEVAPNGKIYIGATNSVEYMHTIHRPNERGKACDFRQHDFRLPAKSYVAFPNIPNYELGASDPNCKLPVSVNPSPIVERPMIRVFPNPVTSNNLTIQKLSYQDIPLQWELYDLQGHTIVQQNIIDEITPITVPIGVIPGLYYWKLSNKQQPLQHGKIVILE